MTSSTAKPPIELPEEAPDLELSVYVDNERVWRGALPDVLEVGRQNMQGRHPEPDAYALVKDDNGTERLVIAAKSERKISRHHLRLFVSRGMLTIRNVSKIQPFRCNHSVVEPGEERTFDWLSTLNIQLHNRKLVIGPTGDSGSLRSLDKQTRTPGSNLMPSSFHSEQMDLTHLEDVPEFMLWLSETIEVLQSAVNSPDFLRLACQAVVDIVKLEHVQALLREEGRWRLHASHTSGQDMELPTPSRQVMTQMMKDRKTVWLLPNPSSTSESLVGVTTVIAAPILDSEGLVIGTIYGDRRTGIGGPGITDLEAKMVEVLAFAVANGLSRMKHEEQAMQARIEAAEQQARLEQFFSPRLASQLLEQPELLDGRDVEVTVLFCDLRNFTKVSDSVATRQVLHWLNAVQDMLSDCVIANNGVLVDYVGDAMLAMWGAPIYQPDHATLACRAAAAMIRNLPELDKTWKSRVGRATEVGIGISTGTAIVGNTGSAKKFKYGPLGRTVNVGSRVQDATRALGTPILVTESTVLRLADEFEIRKVGRIRMHNLQEPETLYELYAWPDDDWLALRTTYETALDAFEDGRYVEAQAGLDELLQRWPEDGPSQCLHRRANQAIDSADTFDDVWSLKKYADE